MKIARTAAAALVAATLSLAPIAAFAEEVSAKAYRAMTPAAAIAVSDGTSDSLRGMAHADRLIARGDYAAARTQLETVLTNLAGVKSLQPIYTVGEALPMPGADGYAVDVYRGDRASTILAAADRVAVTDLGAVQSDQQVGAKNGDVIAVSDQIVALQATLPIDRTYALVAAAADALNHDRPSDARRLLKAAGDGVEVGLLTIQTDAAEIAPSGRG